MDKLTPSKSIVGKSFEYWRNVYEQGLIDRHTIHLRLSHLNYALNHNFITNEEYYVHQLNITDQYNPSYTDYKQCSLMNFCRLLKTYNLPDNNLEINKPLILDEHSEEFFCQIQKSIKNNSENINEQNGVIVDVQEYCLNKKQENKNDQTIKPKKSKKRKRKKKFNNNDCTNIDHTNMSSINVVTDNFEDECDEKMKNSNVTSKNAVKIFIRQINNKDRSQIDRKKSFVSTQRSARHMFSKMLKQFKKERQ